MLENHDTARLRGHARDIQTIAQIHGWPLPDETTAALEMAKEAKRVAMAMPVAYVPVAQPTKPGALAKWITTEAARRLTLREEEQVAEQLVDNLERNALRLTLESSAGLAVHLVNHFPAAVERFAASAPHAPAEITGASTPEQFTAFTEVAQATDALTLAATHRARIAEVLHEEAVTRQPLWLVLAPRADASLFAVTALANDLKHHVPSSVEDWRRAIDIGVKLAEPGGAEQRIATFALATYNSGMASDGGMLDKTYAAALGSAHAAAALIAGQPNIEPQW